MNEERVAWQPRQREAAVSQFSEEHGRAINQGVDLVRTFERLTETMRLLADQGVHMTVVMADELVQQWWVAFRRSRGDLVPEPPGSVPPRMQHEDQIVAEHQLAS